MIRRMQDELEAVERLLHHEPTARELRQKRNDTIMYAAMVAFVFGSVAIMILWAILH